LPLQYEVVWHGPVAAAHTVVEDFQVSAGHAALLPLQ
jgi:hypothetical protein